MHLINVVAPISVVLLLLSPTSEFGLIKADSDNERNSFERAEQSVPEIDEGSCICGLNRDILDKIESIITQASKQEPSACPFSNQQHDGQLQLANQSGSSSEPFNFSGEVQKPQQSNITPSTASGSLTLADNGQYSNDHSQPGIGSSQLTSPEQQNGRNSSFVGKLTDEIQNLQNQLANLLSQNSNQQQNLSQSLFDPSTWRPNFFGQSQQNQDSQHQQQNSKPFVPSISNINDLTGAAIIPVSSNTNDNVAQQIISQPSQTTNSASYGATMPSTMSSFLEGIPGGALGSSLNQQSNLGLNQPSSISGQIGIQTAEVQNAFESTVPNVVSNIFSNIQDLAIQTEKNPSPDLSHPSSNVLTSIDGTSLQLNRNDTTEQITAQGEQLFLQWVEHQIQSFHMTASMASYIRRSALSLFRRIVKQYVKRIERLGGRVEDNVRKATQIALSNTQNLTSFLLRNYLNVAGLLMQIIGDQVSRVGKQLDSTGETIAHINLNPFDIVSNVIASLPNPSHYSEYFRGIGKYLMGENQQESNAVSNQQQGEQQMGNSSEDKKKGLFSKTMGALGKTLGTWLG